MTVNTLSDAIRAFGSASIDLGMATSDRSLDFDGAMTAYLAATADLFAVVHDSRADLAAVGVAATGEAVASRG